MVRLSQIDEGESWRDRLPVILGVPQTLIESKVVIAQVTGEQFEAVGVGKLSLDG
jgi:hypothetical protein